MNTPSRLPADVIRRESILRWITALAHAPMRLVVGPAGTGKSVVLAQAVRERPADSLYICASSDQPLVRAIAEALETSEDVEMILATMSARPVRLLAIDQAERFDENDARFLETFLDDERCNGLLVASRRRNIVRPSLIASGLVALCAPHMLRFDAAECVQLAAAMDLALEASVASHLADACDGWPIAIAGTLRTAYALQIDFLEALERWKLDQRSVVLDFLTAQSVTLPDDAKRTWDTLVAGGSCNDADLRNLERCGGLLIDTGETLRPLRIVTEMVRSERLAQPVSKIKGGPIMVRMFGRFESTIDDLAVPWLRRMDRRIFRYLVLTAEGSVAKDEILKEFWANADERQASQSLRTACSNIRKAIGTLVGAEHVDDYFTAGEKISVNLDNVTVDVRRFISHMRNANAAYDNGDAHTAIIHYKQADQLYTGRLGWGDEEEPALMALAQECERLYILALNRIAETLRKTGAAIQAMRYEAMLNEQTMRKNVARG